MPFFVLSLGLLMGSSEKILVVGPSWVGDMVMAQSLFMRLVQRFPQSEVHVLAPEWSHPILARMPEVKKAINLPLGHGQLGLVDRWRLGKRLRSEAYTRALILPRSWKSALVPFAAKIPLRTGFLGEQRYLLLNDCRKLDKSLLDQTVKRFVALGLEQNSDIDKLPLLLPHLSTSENNQQQLLARFGLSLDRPVVALMPGAEYGPAKQWPLQHFRELAEALCASGFQVWVLGSSKDIPAGVEIAAKREVFIHNLCGKTSLEDVVDLLALCKEAVSNDSGLMHVAAAVGARVHVIYGSSSPGYTPPLTTKACIHWLDLDCSPCFKRTCPYGHYACLEGISSNRVLQLIQENNHKEFCL